MGYKKLYDQGPFPIEVPTSSEMDMKKTETNMGKIYKYTGTTTPVYKQNALYVVENRQESQNN